MSSLPGEILVDALQPLDRWTLDAVQFTSRRFRQLIEELLSSVCLREIKAAHFRSSEGHFWVEALGRPDRHLQFLNDHEDFAGFFSAFLKLLRSAWIADLSLAGINFTPALATLVLEAPIVAHELKVYSASCAELTPSQFHALVLHFSPTELHLRSSVLLASQFSDDFVGALRKNRVRVISLSTSEPVEGGRFCVTDDAIIAFCLQPDDPAEQDGEAKLRVNNGSFTKDLFRHLVEANAVSMRPQTLQIRFEPVRFENEDLRDFAQHLSYRDSWKRVYDFPGQQHGEVIAIDLKITRNSLSKGDVLTVVRARRPNTGSE